jgi:hypothetical protein
MPADDSPDDDAGRRPQWAKLPCRARPHSLAGEARAIQVNVSHRRDWFMQQTGLLRLLARNLTSESMTAAIIDDLDVVHAGIEAWCLPQ